MTLLAIISKIYSFLSFAERKFFEIFGFLVYKPKAKVVSVGNISMGGTGKTPVLFELLSEIKTSVCVLTRGYRSPYERSFYVLHKDGDHPQELTDEALMTNKRFPFVPVLVGKNRHHSAIMGEMMFAPDIFLLDDGFQYRRIRKDFNILLFDAMCDPAEACVLPMGRLREPFERLKIADVILLTRCNSVSEERADYWFNKIRSIAPDTKIIKTGTFCDGLFDNFGNRQSPVGKSYLAFSGIGRPQSFYAQLADNNCKVVESSEFKDHHRFTADELGTLRKRAELAGLTLVCTEKDAVKIPAHIAETMKLEVLRIRVRPLNKEPFLTAMGVNKQTLF